MLDLYKKKIKAEIHKIEAETEETKKKWYKRSDSKIKLFDVSLKIGIFIASVVSVFYISNLYDIKNERLELKRDKLEIQIGLFEHKKDSINNEIIVLSNYSDKLSNLNDSLSDSNENLFQIQTRLKNDSLKQKNIIADLTKQINEIANSEKSKNLQKTLSKLISSSNLPPAKANAGEDISICLGESVTLNGYGGDSYIWSTGATTKSIQVNPIRTTTYTLSAIRGGITDTDKVTVTVENCKSISLEDDFTSDFIVSPNPTTGTLDVRIITSTKELNLVLTNSSGDVVYTSKIEPNQGQISKQIDLSKLPKGVYFVKLFNKNKNMIKKILVN